jgi:SpoVK/Ycf46/Vps4 family AAA+-type ATPase
MRRIQLGNQVEVDPEDISVTFDDVKGADEAKQELKDVVSFAQILLGLLWSTSVFYGLLESSR